MVAKRRQVQQIDATPQAITGCMGISRQGSEPSSDRHQATLRQPTSGFPTIRPEHPEDKRGTYAGTASYRQAAGARYGLPTSSLRADLVVAGSSGSGFVEGRSKDHQ